MNQGEHPQPKAELAELPTALAGRRAPAPSYPAERLRYVAEANRAKTRARRRKVPTATAARSAPGRGRAE